MITVTITEKGGKPNVIQFDKPEISIGRIQGNDIVLAKSNISKRHARIINNDGNIVVVDSKSTNGTYINGKKIDAPYDLRSGDKIFVGDYTLEIDAQAGASASAGGGGAKKAPPPPPAGEAKDDLLSDDEWNKGPGGDDWGDDWGKEDSVKAKVKSTTSELEDLMNPNKTGTVTKLAPPSAVLDDALDGDAFPEPEAKAKPPPSEPTKKSTGEVKKAPPPAPAAKSEPPRVESKPEPKQEPKAPPRVESKPEPARVPSKEQPAVKPAAAAPVASTGGGAQAQAARLVHERLIRSLDLRRLDVSKMDDGELRQRTEKAVKEIVEAMTKAKELPSGVDTSALAAEVLDEALGLGPLEDLLHDDSITEVLVNGPSQIYVERAGRLELSDRSFSSDQAVLGVIERIVAPIGRRIDESSPMVDARLKDGSRVNAVVPPLSLKGPVLTIRKFTKEPMEIDDMVGFGTLTGEMAEFLEVCVKAKKSIVISGGTGSGKTTLLNVLSGFIPATERIITIEDAAELKLSQDHVVSLESRPPNIEGKGQIGIRELVRNALRMRPDRIVVGECRGGEALDMLQAMNTGHDGSLTTVHANGPRDALSRLETMVLMSGMELPIRAIRDQIASAVDVVVQTTRFADGARKVTHISEITGMEGGEVIAMQDIFVFEQKGFDSGGRVSGKFKATGVVPRFYETLKALGIKADLGIFEDA